MGILLAGGIGVLLILGLTIVLFFVRAVFIVDPFAIRKNLQAGRTAQMNLALKLMHAQKALAEKNKYLYFLSSQIKNANQDLSRLNELKTKFFHIVTHEIRNPLGVIT